MSGVFESCLKSLPQGCADCVLDDECAEKQLYEKGRADMLKEFEKYKHINVMGKPFIFISDDEYEQMMKGHM